MTAKQKLFQAIDVLVGKARSTYYVSPLNEYMQGRGKTASASLASNPGVQLAQSQWMSSGTKAMTGGGGTTGKSALWAALVGSGPIPADWTEAQRMTILCDILFFRAFPSAVSFVAHLGLSALSAAQLKTEAKKRWGMKVATAFVAWHKATKVFLDAISELDNSSPAKKKKASSLPNLSELTGYSKSRKQPAKPKASSRPVAPSADLIAKAEELRKGKSIKGQLAEMQTPEGRDAVERAREIVSK